MQVKFTDNRGTSVHKREWNWSGEYLNLHTSGPVESNNLI